MDFKKAGVLCRSEPKQLLIAALSSEISGERTVLLVRGTVRGTHASFIFFWSHNEVPDFLVSSVLFSCLLPIQSMAENDFEDEEIRSDGDRKSCQLVDYFETTCHLKKISLQPKEINHLVCRFDHREQGLWSIKSPIKVQCDR